jgi:hypothetical protein
MMWKYNSTCLFHLSKLIENYSRFLEGVLENLIFIPNGKIYYNSNGML